MKPFSKAQRKKLLKNIIERSDFDIQYKIKVIEVIFDLNGDH